jgi:anti-sigma regulatory factor (Ser/Thr protein kinase)
MGAERKQGEAARTGSIHCLARASRELAAESDPVQALWNLLCTLREHLAIDRAGVFAYDRHSKILEHITGVDTNGDPEFSGTSFHVNDEMSPLLQVARREREYYFTDDAPRDYPHRRFAPGVQALAVIPIIAGDELLGMLCADNCLTRRPLPETVLEPLFLYAGLAALPLFAAYQKKERDRVEAMRRHIYREVLYSVTGGKIQLCEQVEINAEWPSMESPLRILREEDVRAVRDIARQVAEAAGMNDERAADFALCTSEAVTNALLHGSGGGARIECREGRVRVRVTDHGTGIATDDLPRATLLRGWSKHASMGLGFTLINETADRIYLSTGSSGTTIIIEMGVVPEESLPNECNPLLWGGSFSL